MLNIYEEKSGAEACIISLSSAKTLSSNGKHNAVGKQAAKTTMPHDVPQLLKNVGSAVMPKAGACQKVSTTSSAKGQEEKATENFSKFKLAT